MEGPLLPAQVLQQLLELLDRTAPAEQLAQVATHARTRGLSREHIAQIEHATEVALRIRARYSQHQRREAELAALFDTASDLAALGDTDAVLRAIVRRARMLLHTDLAYLSLNDPTAGLTHIEVTDGSISALFQQVSLGFGEGLGGLVGQSARPYTTADYLADTRFNHTDAIDTAVRDEGAVAILGVPLHLGARVIGVLYAADRTTREFTADEVSLLGSLADHASIALDNARLLEESQRTLRELGEASEKIRAHNEAMRRAEEAHDRLSALVLSGADTGEVAGALADVLRGGIVLHDAEGEVLAHAAVGARPQPSERVAQSRSAGRAVLRDGLWVCAVLAGPQLLGSITLTGRAELDDAERNLLERAGVVTALLLLLQRTAAEAEDRVRGELVSDLLTAPQRNPDGLVARGKRVGVDLESPLAVAVLHADGTTEQRLAAAAARLHRSHLVGRHADRVVLMVPGEQPAALAERLAGELGSALSCPVTVGAAGPATGPVALAAAHAEAERCLGALLALGRRGCGADMTGLGFLGAVLGDHADVAGYVRSTLGPVVDYDSRRGTELIRTLRAYFDCGSNISRTKDVLHVHVNTVVQRLERVSVLLGEEWQQPQRVLEVQLALHLHSVITPTH